MNPFTYQSKLSKEVALLHFLDFFYSGRKSGGIRGKKIKSLNKTVKSTDAAKYFLRFAFCDGMR